MSLRAISYQYVLIDQLFPRLFFLIGTSNGSFNGLANTDGGLCAHKNMRLRIEVLPRAPSILATTPKPWGFRPRPIDDSHQDTYDSDGLHPSDADNESGRRRSDSINSYEIVGDGKSAAKEMISWDRSEQSRYEFEGKRADQSSTKQFFIERQISGQLIPQLH